MKKLLAMTGIASPVVAAALMYVVPNLLAIALVLFMSDAILANNYTFNSTGVGANIVGYLLDFFKAGGITQAEVVLGI